MLISIASYRTILWLLIIQRLVYERLVPSGIIQSTVSGLTAGLTTDGSPLLHNFLVKFGFIALALVSEKRFSRRRLLHQIGLTDIVVVPNFFDHIVNSLLEGHVWILFYDDFWSWQSFFTLHHLVYLIIIVYCRVLARFFARLALLAFLDHPSLPVRH